MRGAAKRGLPLRVLRGGSWNNNGRNCRAANRNRNEPGERNNNNGFRVVLSASTCHCQSR
ncbi:MAG: SUMF1/EgtB/PvdO family nonheme iron enzyme [Acidobacteria bacterium]|nr:SUMF1/EgtB/PvdO family nonheme iron enzyme [Acidobacteriota bacterium]